MKGLIAKARQGPRGRMSDRRDERKPLDLWADICNHKRTVAPVITSIQGVGHQAHQQKNLFHRTYRARVRTRPVRSLPPVLPDLLSPLCHSSLASGAPGGPTFPPKRPTPSWRPHPLPAPSCCIRPLIFSSTGLLPTLTNCAHPAALPDPLSPLAT